ncbi:MAG: hypothetical protein U9N59_06480 [Campylobacterota bacterium]|nr:hypothetical protein [Campylobacterota bacterium]
MIITKHGNKRIKERLGLPKRAQNRHINVVLKNGVLASRKGFEGFKIIYHGFLYIFSLTNKLEPILVTTYQNTNTLYVVE